MKPQVDISILAANFNNGDYLDQFFQSIADSEVLPKEIIFIDDGSTDDSLIIAEKYNHLPGFQLLTSSKNQGFSAALNQGKYLCTCKYTMRVDPDDILMPDRISKQYNYMEAHPNVDVCGGNVVYFNSKTGAQLNESRFPLSNIAKVYENGQNGVLHPTVIIKTKLYKEYNYIQMRPGQDYELFARIAKDGYQFANLPDILNRMRVHPASAVSNMTYKSLSKLFDARDRIFNKKTPFLKKYAYYQHLNYYRKGMLAESIMQKYAYFALSAIWQPDKVIKRLF